MVAASLIATRKKKTRKEKGSGAQLAKEKLDQF
jgi:hypothetical protein